MIYKARQSQLAYGRPLGVMVLEERIPCPPGVPGNPTTFDFPIMYEVVRGVSAADLKGPNPDPEPFLRAARNLAERGACAIVGGCGLMVVHQDALASASPIPVHTSSLMLLPLLLATTPRDAQVGVIVSRRHGFEDRLLGKAGPVDLDRVAIGGMDGRPCFEAAICDEIGALDFDAVTREFTEAMAEFRANNPKVAALLLECVDLPPYAHAVQSAVDLPIYDVTTLAQFARSGFARMAFSGIF